MELRIASLKWNDNDWKKKLFEGQGYQGFFKVKKQQQNHLFLSFFG